MPNTTAAPVGETSQGALSTLVHIVGDRGGKPVKRGLTAFALWQVFRPAYASARSWVQSRTEHVVTVRDSDEVFGDLQRWMLDQMPPKKRRSLTVGTGNVASKSGETMPVDSSRPAPVARKVRIVYDGNRVQTVSIGGHRVHVSIERDDAQTILSDRGGPTRTARDERIVFRAFSVAAREAVIDLIGSLVAERAVAAPRCYIATRWGGWDRHDELATRSYDSVVLAAGLKERIFDDLTQFRSHEADYRRLGIPFHHGILLYGPPGGGKSSLACVIASLLNLDVYYMPLSDMNDDVQLINMIAGVGPNSLLLLEDIDVVHAATSREEGKYGGATLSGLLNALDGLTTPHGLLTAMTTNDIGALDEALIRDGRADDRYEVDNLVPEQFDRLVRQMLGVAPLVGLAPGVTLSAATVVGAIKRNLDDRAAALNALAVLSTGSNLDVAPAADEFAPA